MRINLMLSAAAALAVGAFTAQAQVYSVNVVGYVNDAHSNGQFSLVQNPLDSGTNANLNSVLAGAPAGSTVFIWNGAAYDTAVVGAKTGVWGPDYDLLTGVGFFYKPTADITNTYVGEVGAAPGESVTNSLTDGVIDLTGALLPFATASIATDAQFGLVGAGAGSTMYKWNGSSYDTSVVGAKTGVWGPDLSVDVGEAVFINVSSGNFDWVQTLPAN